MEPEARVKAAIFELTTGERSRQDGEIIGGFPTGLKLLVGSSISTNIHRPMSARTRWSIWLVIFSVVATAQVTETLGETVISQIRVAPRGGQTEIEVSASEPINYVLWEGVDPVGITLFFLDATFAFPPREQTGIGGAIRRMTTRVLEKEGSRLATLDVVFNERAAYSLTPEGRRLRIRVELPSKGPETTWGGESPVAATPPPKPAPATPSAPSPPPAPPPPPASPSTRTERSSVKLLKLRTEQLRGQTLVTVDSTGPLTYKTFALDHPTRVVIDFEGAGSELRGPFPVPNGSDVRQIRSSEFQAGVIRLVIELRRAALYRVEPKADGIVVRIGSPAVSTPSP
jgi:hypothetical protein